ncbi:MAG: DUF2309 domain-containing protein [Leeuwenhoekiella sp.]
MSAFQYKQSLKQASQTIGTTWPLYSFVTSNPLSGFENAPFEEAINNASKQLGAAVLPDVSLFEQALDKGDIDSEILIEMLKEQDISLSIPACLKRMNSAKKQTSNNEYHNLDRIMTKWLSSFMDEGLAEWSMPNKNLGFYKAWRLLAIYDEELDVKKVSEIPESGEQVLEEYLEGYGEAEVIAIFEQHLAALPGWCGYVKHRMESGSDWQQQFPITLQDYIAVRLYIAKNLNLPFITKNSFIDQDNTITKIKLVWLRAWELSYQKQLLHSLNENRKNKIPKKNLKPDAQLVFCIDTRSELIRRHVEASGNYESFGYAGFFGIAMDYVDSNDGVIRKSCPPIVGSAYKVTEVAQAGKEEESSQYQHKNTVANFKDYFLKRMKNMLPSAFGYVEGSGLVYVSMLLSRTFAKGLLYRRKNEDGHRHETHCEPKMNHNSKEEVSEVAIREQAAIVKSAFDIMGWKEFAPLVIFAGHGSHTANNPFGSSLDCGACAASPGRNNARMLAKMANDKGVRQILQADHNLNIPEETVFIGAEHNTTTDAIVLFDSQVPVSFRERLERLKSDLATSQMTATQDRLNYKKDGKALAENKANDWSETRPEWGLAKNAGFVIGPRQLTKNTNLNSRSFLQSYNWQHDSDGSRLEAIMQGPVTVTQWINNHYYFCSVDTEVFGGGSKITHNITGKFGVLQGNGGDLKKGLPLQSLMQTDEEMYHQPLRLSVVIQAPAERITTILDRNPKLMSLLDNEWIYMIAIDPTKNNKAMRYSQGLRWSYYTSETSTFEESSKQVFEPIPA